MRYPFPEIINSSLIANFRSCGQKTLLADFQSWKPRTPSVHLIAGAAFARGLEVTRRAYYEDGDDPETAVAMGFKALIEAYGDFECPPESGKSCERMAGALEYYFDRYPLGDDPAEIIKVADKYAIEFNFSEPLEINHPETGQPLIYTGRFDAMVKYSGLTLGCDEKTTSQLGASWPRQWDLRSQFTAYTWGAGKAGIKLDGFLVRGVSILKSKYDTAEAITYRPTWQIDRWYDQLHADLKRMITAWESGQWDYNLDHACAEYGGCPFRSVCLLRDPTELLAQQFERRHWDPVTRTETLLEEAS